MPDVVDLAGGGYTASVDRRGARLVSMRRAGHPLVTETPPGERPARWDGCVLAPWPNRIVGGRYHFGGRQLQLPVNEPERDSALHGLVADLDWSVTSVEPRRAQFAVRLDPSPGYPWRIALDVTYAVGGEGLTVLAQAENHGDSVAPFGCGFHPYLRAPDGEIDHPDVDDAFDGAPRDSGGRAMFRLPGRDSTVVCWWDRAFPWFQLYTPGPGDDGRRASIAVEPMTCPPDAFNSGRDLVLLRPGDRWSGSWGIAEEATSSASTRRSWLDCYP